MSIADAEMSPESKRTVKLVRVEVEVPEDAVEEVQAFASALRGGPSTKARDFKEFLTSPPAWPDELVDLVNDRDKRPAREIEL